MDVNVVNSIIILATSYLLLVSPNSQLPSEKMFSQSCINIRKNSTILSNCTYHWPKVSCEMVTMATSNETLTQVDLKQYLRFVLQFRILGILYKNMSNTYHGTTNASETEALHECLSLEKLTITKEKAYDLSINNHASVDVVPFPILLQLAALEEINIEFAFNSRKPVAYVKVINRSPNVLEVRVDYHINFTLGEDFFNASLKTVLEEKLKQFSGIQGTITKLHIEQSSNIDIKIWENVVSNKSRDLRMNGGRWTRLGKKQLPPMLFLKVLDLSSNEINIIEDDTFEMTPNLEALSLSSNKLTKLSSSISSLKNLQVLDLSRNPSLNMKNNNVVLKSLTNLLWLNLSHIPLMNLQPLNMLYEQRNSSELMGLMLRKCNLIITEADVEFFDHMNFLVELDLSENQLSSLPVDLFHSLESLRVLKLASNRFSQFHFDLRRSINLKYMDLSNNKIVHLNQVQIEGKTDEINLSENAIISWENSNTFTDVEYLNQIRIWSINLSLNSITSVSEDMIRIFSVLKSVDLGGNPLNCSSCNTPLLQTWLQENKTTIIFNLGVVQNLTCADLENNYRNVTDVNFTAKICSQDTDDPDFALAVGIPLLVLAALILLSVIAVYGYRYEITYIRHLVNIRRQRHIKDSQSIERYKYDAFVSYSAADRDWVMKELQPHLEQGTERYRLCLHERDFALGSIIADNIVECMKDSRNTLVILTPHFVKSQWCRWELEVANHKLFEDDREFLILIELKKLDKKTLPRHLAYLVDTRTYLEWPKGHGSHHRAWARLKYALGESLYQRRIKERSKAKDIETDIEQDQVDMEII